MSIFLQIDTIGAATNAVVENVATKKELTLMEIIFSGGIIGQAVMTVIFIMLFFTIYLYLERLMAINAASKMDQNFMTQIKMHLQQGKIDNAKMLCASTNSPVARLIEKGISRIGKPLDDINMAIENELIDGSKYPFKKYTIPAPQKISRTLKKDEIKSIINHKPINDTDAKALDYWIFSFVSNGMNFKDVCLLKYENIKGDFIEFRRAKTKRSNKNNSLPIMVPLNETLLNIIKKRGNKSKKNEDYIFPILVKGLTPQEEYDHIKTFVRNTNKRLTKIGKELGTSLKVTSYVARHCFATIQKNNNAPLAYISEALGHANLKTTQNYFGRFEDDGLKVFHSGLMEGLVE